MGKWPCWDATFNVEIALLLLAAPFLYFPERFPTWTTYASIGVLALGWAWRRWRLGIWFRRTPADWPIFFLFLVMLPISLWAAPEPLRIQYSVPKAYVLVWNFFLFWAIVTHASRSWALTQVAVAGLGGYFRFYHHDDCVRAWPIAHLPRFISPEATRCCCFSVHLIPGLLWS